MDTLGTKTCVLISEVYLFQGKNNMYSYKVGIQSSVLVNQMSLFRRCPLRELGSTVYTHKMMTFIFMV